MKNLTGIFMVVFLASNIFGTNISGEIIDQNQDPVVFAHVILNSTIDSYIVKLEYSQDDVSYTIMLERGLIGLP